MENLLWGVGAAAAVYFLAVRPLQQQLAAVQSRDVGGDVGGGMTSAELAGGVAGAARVTVAGMAPAAKPAGCGCGG